MAKMSESARVSEICRRLSQVIKDPRSELHYVSDYTFLISVVMSAQTTDVQVNKVTDVLFKKYNTIDQILALGVDGLSEQIKSIGFFRTKAKHIIELSKILKEKFNSKVPDTREQLMTLPGVGQKTANVVLNTLFHKPFIAVDTHVLRLSKKLGLSENTDPKKVEEDLLRNIPEKYHSVISDLLVLFGRYVCSAKKPKCKECPLADICPAVLHQENGI